ncbi:hypothetical protein Fmac_002020 [Flemingia macrophylla]|uniref:Uncharacterized protein n=1 Tax=Flemingia macrophylla TaxID=520843 RepID=A0ABD1NLJ6_9FABA
MVILIAYELVYAVAINLFCDHSCRKNQCVDDVRAAAIQYMRGAVALVLLSAKCRFRQSYSMNGSRGLLATATPKKQENNNEAGETKVTKEMIDPIVILAFSRPPPLPPVIGPLVALSLFDTWWNRDTDEYGK